MKEHIRLSLLRKGLGQIDVDGLKRFLKHVDGGGDVLLSGEVVRGNKL